MLTIEKQPGVVQKVGVLMAAFLIGLVGSLSTLHTIDPKNNATVIQTTSSTTQEKPKEERTASTTSSPSHKPTPTHTETPTWTQPAQPATEPVQLPSNEDEESTPNSDATSPDKDTAGEEDSKDDSLLTVPLLRLLLP